MDEGYNPAYGARPLRRAIMRLLEDSMAERMLAGDIKEGDSVILDGAPRPAPPRPAPPRSAAQRSPRPAPQRSARPAPLRSAAQRLPHQPWTDFARLCWGIRSCTRGPACARLWRGRRRGSVRPPRARLLADSSVRSSPLPLPPSSPAPVLPAVDADGQITVLNGDKKMTQMIDSTPAGIS